MARVLKRIHTMPFNDNLDELVKQLEKSPAKVVKKKSATCMIHITEVATLWCPICGVRLCSKCSFIHKLISTHHEANAEQLSISQTPNMMPS